MVNKEIISSKDNRKVKELRKLHQRKYRKKTGQFLIEGEHLIEEAVRFKQEIHLIVLTESAVPSFDVETFECMYVSDSVMKVLSSLETPPGMLAVVSYIPANDNGNRVLALDGIQDPGNLGTLIRTADAFGFSRLILSEDTTDPFSDKVLRSAQGSTFHLNIQSGSIVDAVNAFDGLTIGTSLEGSVFLEESTPESHVMVVLGNEGQGVSSAVLNAVDQKVKIQMTGFSESLNVAVAGSIIMHHFKA
ncbi:TrmH family RNA methyltransferase [Corticicoccus populi]|uniref:TrmH family RNA methyltransferase n=1 Tax=Corticicoccus populi TaxID=1812821 RepID=A0ABW5WTA2_9STAP